MMMQKMFASLLLIVGISACSQKKGNSLPAPASVDAVQKIIAGKTFTTERVGTVSAFATTMDKEDPNKWFDEEKELDDFAKKYQAERKGFSLQFVNDTLVKITDDGKTWDAVYKIDAAQQEEEKAGLKFRFTYPDKEGTMNFPGATEPMVLTTTYIIAGTKGNEMVLESPRQFNGKTVVLWMKAK